MNPLPFSGDVNFPLTPTAVEEEPCWNLSLGASVVVDFSACFDAIQPMIAGLDELMGL